MSKINKKPLPEPYSINFVKNRSDQFYKAANLIAGVQLSDPTDWLCLANACKYDNDDLPLYRDSGHLNLRGAAYIQPWLDKELINDEQ